MAIKESYVKVKEVVVKTPSAGSVSNSSNVAGVIVAPVGPKLAYITSPSEFLDTYTVNGTIPRNADTTFINAYYLSYFTGLVLARSINTTAVGGIVVCKSSDPVRVIYKDGQLLGKQSEVTLDVNVSGGIEDNWHMKINDYGFYHGSLTSDQYDKADVWIKVDDLESLDDVLNGFDEFNVVGTEASGSSDAVKKREFTFTHNLDYIEISDVDGITVETLVPRDGVYTLVNTATYGSTDDWMFVVKGKLPLASNSNSILINSIEGSEQFTLTINDEKFLCSMNPDMTDDNGVNMYIEYINTLGIDFEVEVINQFINGDTGKYYSPANVDGTHQEGEEPKNTFGASGFDIDACKDPKNLTDAVNFLADQEVYDVEYLAPLGITKPTVLRNFMIVSRDKKWFCPIDVPPEYTSYTAIKRFSEAIDGDGIYSSGEYGSIPGSILLGPFDKNTSLTGWRNYIAASTLYFERVMANKGQNAEFAPVFKNSYGTVNCTDPVKLLLKSDREKLLSLSLPVNWIVYDQKSDSYYINDNRTRTTDQTSVVCEEQNSRIVWKISKDIDKILDQFISQYNTKATRARVVDVLDYYFKWTIMNQQFPPDDYEIICDETINTPEVINANKLAVIVKVRLYKAIKYVEVTNKVYPLGVDFNQSL